MPLCTECRKPIQDVVAIDIDGTLGDYHSHFLDFAEGYLGEPMSFDYQGSGSFRAWFCNTHHVSEDTWRDIKLAYRQGGMKRTMPVFPFARQLCDNIKCWGAELWLTTTRPAFRFDNIDPDTREWLRRNDIPYDYLIYDGDKYDKLFALVGEHRVVAVLDDLQFEIRNAVQLFGPDVPILRYNSYNSKMGYRHYARNLKDANEMIKERIAGEDRGYPGSSEDHTGESVGT